MSNEVLSLFAIGVVLTLVVGLYGLVTTRNLIRTLIALEILTKGVTLLLIVAGRKVGQIGLAQSLAITLIIIEVAVIVAAVGVVLCIHRKTDSVDAGTVEKIKG